MSSATETVQIHDASTNKDNLGFDNDGTLSDEGKFLYKFGGLKLTRTCKQ